MRASIIKRMRLVSRILGRKDISAGKRIRFENKLSFLKGLRDRELKEGVTLRFHKWQPYGLTGYSPV